MADPFFGLKIGGGFFKGTSYHIECLNVFETAVTSAKMGISLWKYGPNCGPLVKTFYLKIFT